MNLTRRRNKMRLGKVKIEIEYVVDLDNDDMVEEATNCLYEKIMNAVKYNEVFDYIKVTDEDKTLKEKDIPEFLKEDEGDWV
jgi:hypothetical protein